MEWTSLLRVVTTCKLQSTPALNKTFKREDELMCRLWADESLRKIISSWLKDLYDKREFKSIAKAQDLKKKGNEEFQRKNYIQSIESYTKCAMYAPIDSDELSVAIANRSASLFRLNRFDNCIQDTKLAIKLNYPKKLHYKLYLRAAQCYLKLSNEYLAEEMLSKVHEITNNPEYISPLMKDCIVKRISEVKLTESSIDNNIQDTSALLKLKSQIVFNENPNFPFASTSVDRNYNKKLGRHVVANRFIKKGEILFFEKPVAFVLLHKDELNYLCHCCNQLNINTPVPCTKCLNTLYCKTECSDEAWRSYHRWECMGKQINLWKQIGVGHLALKILLNCSTMTDIIKFNEMQNLLTNFKKQSTDNLTAYGITAIMLTTYLLEYTDFFETNNINDCLVNKFAENTFNSNFNVSSNGDKKLYISSLLLRYILQVICNAHEITCTNALSDETSFSIDQQSIGTAIYPSASIMNHSCDHNIISIFIDQYLICKAAADIAINEEVFNCYGPHYRHMSRDQRKEALSHYYFTCECKPCTLPELQYFVERFDAMKCMKCNGALCHIQNSLKCLDCHDNPKNYPESKVKQAEELFEIAEDFIDSGEIEKALDLLKECLNIRRNVFYQYNKDITTTLNLIGRSYCIIGQWENSIQHLEDTIPAIIERCGSTSTELLNLVIDLIEMYIKYLQNNSNTTTNKYRSMHIKLTNYLEQIEELVDYNYGSWNIIKQHMLKYKLQLIQEI